MGWILIDLFFVLSGFLVAGILLDSRERSDYFRTFYMRRALRILPLYYAVLLIVTAIALLVRDPSFGDMLVEWGSPAWFFVYLGNVPMAVTNNWPHGAHDAYVPLWSLQIEEQFYLLFPLLVYRLRKETLARTLASLAVVSLVLRLFIHELYPDNELASYVLLPCHMEGLALGALIAVRYRMGPWNIPNLRLMLLTIAWTAVALLTSAWSGYDHDTDFNRTFGYFIGSVACAHVVLLLVQNRGSILTAPLRFAPIQYAGRMSYGLYMLHQPVVFLLVTLSTLAGSTVFDVGPVRTIAAICGTFLVASLSWRYFESPLLRMRDRLERAHTAKTRRWSRVPA
jgi:peptidoglycan/LPS O-acetylase OafA/YrhL